MTAIRKSTIQKTKFQHVTSSTTDYCASNDRLGFTVFHLINPAVFDFVRIMYHYLDIRFVSCMKQIVSYGKQSISTCCVMLKHMMCLLAAHRNCYLGDGIISV